MDYFFAVISKAIKGYMFKINNNNIVIFENDLGFFIFFFIFTLFYKFTHQPSLCFYIIESVTEIKY